jgi:Tol biopolymer transport system component
MEESPLTPAERGGDLAVTVGTHTRFFALIAVPCLMLMPVSRTKDEAPLFAEKPPSWFAEIGMKARVSPDGRWAVYGGRGRARLIDLRSGRDEERRFTRDLDVVRDAVFDDKGGLLRRGRRGKEEGWFSGEGVALRLLPIPDGVVPHVSPDGRRIAFLDRSGDQWVVRVSGPGEQRVHVLPERPTGFSWMPRGEALVVLTSSDAGVSTLWRLALEGGELSRTAADLDAVPRDARLAVSADARRAYLALAGPGAPRAEARHEPVADRDLDIYEVELASGERRAVVRTDADEFAPAVAAGHLYWTSARAADEVVLIPLKGGAPSVLVPKAQLPRWSPDGRRLAFTFGDWRVADWALNLDAAWVQLDERRRVASPPRPAVTGWHEDFTPVWSPAGGWVAYHSHRSATPVIRYDQDGGTDDIYLRRLEAPMATELRLTDYGQEAGMPDWAPEGRRIAFASADRRGDRSRVAWVVRIDSQSGAAVSRTRVPLPRGIGDVMAVAWSPSGEQLALEILEPSSLHALWIVGPDGAGPRKLSEYRSTGVGGVDWTPDGALLVFVALHEGRMRPFAIPASGGDSRPLAVEGGDFFHPQVSPDGRFVACTRVDRVKQIHRRPL